MAFPLSKEKKENLCGHHDEHVGLVSIRRFNPFKLTMKFKMP